MRPAALAPAARVRIAGVRSETPSWPVNVALALLQAAVLLWLGTQLGTSRDEEYALRTTAQGPAYALHRALTYELQAPLYFVLCALWRTLDASMIFARAFSILIVVATTFVVASISRRLRPQGSPLAAASIFALSPMAIYSAVDIRAYALAIFFVALATLAFLDGWWSGRRTSARAAFVVFAILAVYTQYYAAFSVAGLAIGLAVAGRRREWMSYVACASVVAAATAVLVHIASSQFASYDFESRPPLAALKEVISEPLKLFFVPVQGFGGYRIGYAIVVVAFFTIFAAGRIDWRLPLVRFAAGTVAGIYLCYIVSALALHVYFYPPRHYFVFVVPLLVAALAAIEAMDARLRLRGARALAAIYVATALFSAQYQYRALAKFGDWRRVGAYVADRARPGDEIAVFEADAVPAFRRFFPSPTEVRPFPHAVDPNRYDPDALVVHSAGEARAALRGLMAGRPHLFLAVDCAYGERYPHEGCAYVTLAIDALYPHRGRADFYHAWVAELPSERLPAATRSRAQTLGNVRPARNEKIAHLEPADSREIRRLDRE